MTSLIDPSSEPDDTHEFADVKSVNLANDIVRVTAERGPREGYAALVGVLRALIFDQVALSRRMSEAEELYLNLRAFVVALGVTAI